MPRIRLVHHEACSKVGSLNVLYNVHVHMYASCRIVSTCRYMHGCLFVHLSVQHVHVP